jgi:uncharacterized protein (TIGR03435 family)
MGGFVLSRKCHSFLACLGLLAFSAAHAQEKPARLTYEIASVRPSDRSVEGGSVTPFPNGIGYHADRVTVRDMLAVMYRIPSRQVVGGPEWVYTENFDVVGRADGTYSIDELHVMFENLLMERFNLKLHFATETGPVYMLRVAKSGLKMKAVPVDTTRRSPIQSTTEYHMTGEQVPLNYLCFWLGQLLQSDQRPVVDRTGLTGTYSFKLRFRPQSEPSVSAADSGEEEYLPSIFQALREQLGLELTPERGPVSKLVIDHIEKPSAN